VVRHDRPGAWTTRQDRARAERVAEQLVVAADPGGFTLAEVADVAVPVRRYFTAAIAPGTPLARAARLRITGTIRFGGRWLPFRSNELLAPLHGYEWPATVAWRLIRGSDTYVDGDATMVWRLFGLVPVVRTRGPDVARSAAGRAAAEAVWAPTAMLPRYGTRWRGVSDDHLVAELPVGGSRVTVHVRLDHDAHVRSVHLNRWTSTDGAGSHGWRPFGIDVTATRTFTCGLTIPAEGVGGWFHDTDRWAEGQFMRYAISDVEPV
jgi:hypothetical protein